MANNVFCYPWGFWIKGESVGCYFTDGKTVKDGCNGSIERQIQLFSDTNYIN